MKDYNEFDNFVFVSPFGRVFTCKLYYDKGYWWTKTPISYKCDTLKRL